MVARAHDRVQEANDPTAHAVVGALREAARKLGDDPAPRCDQSSPPWSPARCASAPCCRAMSRLWSSRRGGHRRPGPGRPHRHVHGPRRWPVPADPGHLGPRRPGPDVRRGEDRAGAHLRRRQAAGPPLPRPPVPGPHRRRGRPPEHRLRPPLPDPPGPVGRPTPSTSGVLRVARFRARTATANTGAPVVVPPRASTCRTPRRSPTTGAASWRSAPVGCCSCRPATAAAVATPRTTRRTSRASRARSSGSRCSARTAPAATPTACRPATRSAAPPRVGARSGPAGCATPGGSRSTRSPVTSGSATSVRTGSRRSTRSRPGVAGANLGWSCREGPAEYNASRCSDDHDVPRAGLDLRPRLRLDGHRRLRLPRQPVRRCAGRQLPRCRLRLRPGLRRRRRAASRPSATSTRHHELRRGRRPRAVGRHTRRRPLRAECGMSSTGRVAQVWVFPVKSMSGAFAGVGRGGRAAAWTVTGPGPSSTTDGATVTAAEEPRLREVTTRLLDGGLRLDVPGAQPGLGVEAAAEALSGWLGRPLHLAHREGAGFVDVAPVHVVSRTSMADAEHAEQCDACDVSAPRANLVLDLDGTGTERDWVGATVIRGRRGAAGRPAPGPLPRCLRRGGAAGRGRRSATRCTSRPEPKRGRYRRTSVGSIAGVRTTARPEEHPVSDLRITVDGSERQVAAGTTAGELFADDRPRGRRPGRRRAARPGLRAGRRRRGRAGRDRQRRTAATILRHSTAHVLAQAVQELFPEAKLGIGPPIENGFYYDFDVDDARSPPRTSTSIEKRMQQDHQGGPAVLPPAWSPTTRRAPSWPTSRTSSS